MSQTPPSAAAGQIRSRRTRRSVLRAVIAVAVIAGWLALAAIGGPKIGQLSGVQSNNQATSLPADAESVRAAAAQAQFSDVRSLPAFVVFNAPAPDDAQRAAWQSYLLALPTLPVLDGVLADYLDAAPVVPVPSADGASMLAVVPIKTSATLPDDSGERPLTAIVAELRATSMAVAGPAGAAHVAGPAGLTADLSKAFEGIDGLLLLVALGVVLAILVLVYRAVALPFVVLFNSVCALALAGLIVYRLADDGTITLNGQSQGILFILVVGAATDYGLLLVARYREELTRHERPWQALATAWRACVAPILASAATVIAGLLCLLLSNLAANRSLGPVGAIGIACAALGGLTLLPALLLAGRWLFWPRIPRVPALSAIDHEVLVAADSSDRHGRHELADGDSSVLVAAPPAGRHERPEPSGRHERPEAAEGEHPVWGRIAEFVGRRPRPIWIVTGLLLVLACLAVPTFKATGTTAREAFLTETDSVVGQQVLEDHFSGLIGDPAVVVTTVEQGEPMAAALAGLPGVDGAVVRTDLATQQPLVVNGQVQVLVTIKSSVDAQDALREVRTTAHAVAPDSLVGGTVARQVDTTDIATSDLWVIFPVVLGVVFLVLTVLLRSIVAPVLLTVATVLSFGAALGISALVFNHVLDFPGSDPAIPLFAFVFLVALGVDYSIFLMSRAREEVLLAGPREGVLRALEVTGGVITSAGVVLAATFATLVVIPLIFLVQIAFIVAFGVLLDTLVVRTLLVPALALELGRRTWWPSRLSRIPPDPGEPVSTVRVGSADSSPAAGGYSRG